MKRISIFGDSISTFEGCNPSGYAVFYDHPMQRANGLRDVHDTWWDKTIGAIGGTLLMNDSYSGSEVTGTRFPAGCSARRIRDIRTEEEMPDCVLIYLGINDFACLERISREDTARQRDPRFFEDAYDIMLEGIRATAPDATIVAGTLMRTVIAGDDWVFPEDFAGTRLEDYNNAIRRSARRNSCRLADLGALGMRYETLDGTHPTAEGHAAIAQAWRLCLKETGI